MKISVTNPLHWLYLLISFTWVLVSLPFALLRRQPESRPSVVLYGHKLSGNLLAIYTEANVNNSSIDPWFLTLDPVYYSTLRKNGVRVLLALHPVHMFRVATCQAIVTDHGLHTMFPFLLMGKMAFVDVWHGIPFKGFDGDDFRIQHRYDAVLVSSRLVANLYEERFGFDADRIRVTGYARTDRIVHDSKNEELDPLASVPNLASGSRFIMFAPTWKQDDPSRSPFPFDIEPTEFLSLMQSVCKIHSAYCLLRMHLNEATIAPTAFSRVIPVPFELYPDTESLLRKSEILISDWSSIVFDYLILNRPTIFVDVSPPFAKGLSLDSSFRYGYIVNSQNELFSSLDKFLADTESYPSSLNRYAEKVEGLLYDNNADGNASARTIAALTQTIRLKHSISD